MHFPRNISRLNRRTQVLQKSEETVAPIAPRETPVSLIKLFIIVILAVVMQTTIAPYLMVLGAKPDVALVIVVSLALMRGPIWGSIIGFFIGLLMDTALVQTMGISSFLYTLAGYFSGRISGRTDPASWVPPLATVFTATLLVQVLNGVIMFLLGVEASAGFVIFRVVLPTAFLNALLASPAFAICRWWLGVDYRQNVFSTKH